jgi:hypothetical protein
MAAAGSRSRLEVLVEALVEALVEVLVVPAGEAPAGGGCGWCATGTRGRAYTLRASTLGGGVYGAGVGDSPGPKYHLSLYALQLLPRRAGGGRTARARTHARTHPPPPAHALYRIT